MIICGMMTHMCVNATIRATKDLDFDCIVIGDACATKNLKYKGELVEAVKVHQSFLTAMSYFDVHVTDAENFLLLE